MFTVVRPIHPGPYLTARTSSNLPLRHHSATEPFGYSADQVTLIAPPAFRAKPRLDMTTALTPVRHANLTYDRHDEPGTDPGMKATSVQIVDDLVVGPGHRRGPNRIDHSLASDFTISNATSLSLESFMVPDRGKEMATESGQLRAVF